MAKQTTSTGDERQEELRRNYLQAIENRHGDLADAKSDDEAFAVLDNITKAGNALMKSIKEGLEGNAPAIETVFKDLKSANDLVETGRKNAEKLASLFGKMKTATDSATGLATALEKAAKAGKTPKAAKTNS